MSSSPPGGSPRDDYSECDAASLGATFAFCASSLTRCVSRVQLEDEGTYECSVTGLVFEASERVLVRYSVLSWSKFGAFLRDSWKFAGPIFNVDTVNKDASVLKSIQFPLSVCCYGENMNVFSGPRFIEIFLLHDVSLACEMELMMSRIRKYFSFHLN